MSSLSRRGLLAAALAAGFALPAPAVQAAEWPEQSITLVAPFTPGGTTDIVARTVAAQLSKRLGQQVVVENKPGAGGTLGVGYAARAKPDGYTLVQSNAGFTVMSNMYKDLPFDFTNGMTHVTTELSVPLILVVAKDAPINSVQELLAYAKANPGKTNYGSPGIGTLQHLAAELLKKRTGMEAMHVPFKGASPMIVDLIAGREQFAFDTSASAITHIKGGRVKPLAVTSSTRLAALPNVPTVAESGVPGYEMTAWYSLAGPKGMPRAAIDRITKAVQDSMQDPSMQKFLAEMAADPGGMDHDKFNVLVQKTAKDLDELTRGMAPQ